MKTPIGNVATEAVSIAHIVTDEDGSLKIKQIDEFRDSKAHSELMAMIAGTLNT